MHFNALTSAVLVALAGVASASPIDVSSRGTPSKAGQQPPKNPHYSVPPKPSPSKGPGKPPGHPPKPSYGGPPKPGPTGGPGGPDEPALGLNTAMISKGREWFGTALTIRDDAAEQALASNYADFGSVTPENAMKWESTEPTRGNFTLAGGDAVVAFAEANGQQVHCHTLVWHSQLPEWVSEGGFDNATLIEVMKDHIREVAGHWKGKCDRWDVVNEALNEDGTYRESVFYTTIGEAYLPIAFAFAHEIDPKATLYYNDYNLEYGEAKTEGAKRIVQLIQSYGAPIHGVGFQGHLAGEPTPTAPGPAPAEEDFTATLQGVADLGVEVAITELDIRMNTPVSEAGLEVHADAYERAVSACLNVKDCVGITVWGVSDAYSWIPGVFEGEGAALLWDEDLQKKPAYNATLNAILRA